MAYDPKGLSALAYANGFTLWHYTSPDPAATVDTIGYFNKAAGFMRANDMIFATTNTAATVENGIMVVKTNTGVVVDVANLNALGLSNSD